MRAEISTHEKSFPSTLNSKSNRFLICQRLLHILLWKQGIFFAVSSVAACLCPKAITFLHTLSSIKSFLTSGFSLYSPPKSIERAPKIRYIHGFARDFIILASRLWQPQTISWANDKSNFRFQFPKVTISVTMMMMMLMMLTG